MTAVGTFDKPYAVDSPWNSRPVKPVLGTAAIPTTSVPTYYPVISDGSLSTQAFKAVATDPPMTITGVTASGVWNPDAEAYQPSVTIAHWPASAAGATGNDGHCEVVDTVYGIVHSFWQLRKQADGTFKAQQWATTALAGRGWGDPAHYMQGARSAGVSTLGGLIRSGEVDEGGVMYRHALAMSLDYTGLSSAPTYVFPATSADTTAATNSGPFPLGSLMMLPPDFDTSKIASVQLRKVCETLKVYGAYVVDRNSGTPFVIYVENGSTFSLNPALAPGTWDGVDKEEMQVIRAALRRMVSAASWIDGDGKPFAAPSESMNLLSMRGKWTVISGAATAAYSSSWQQLQVTGSGVVANESGRAYSGVTWARPVKGKTYSFRVYGPALGRIVIVDAATGKTEYDSGYIAAGASHSFAWPIDSFAVHTYVRGNPDGSPAIMKFDLRAV